jgi:DNA invertase Pin-like site-specific DNA recombinase
LFNVTHEIGEAGSGFKVLDNPALDTTTPHGKLLFDVLAAIGEFERKLIASRTAEGRKLAKARGVHMGRPSKLNLHQRGEALARVAAGESFATVARTYDDCAVAGRLTTLPPVNAR